MYITSYGISLPCPTGSRIYGDVPSQFIGSKSHDGGELLVNGKPMGPDFPHRKREQYLGYVPSSSSDEWKQQEVWEKKENKQRDTSHSKIPDSLAKNKYHNSQTRAYSSNTCIRINFSIKKKEFVSIFKNLHVCVHQNIFVLFQCLYLFLLHHDNGYNHQIHAVQGRTQQLNSELNN